MVLRRIGENEQITLDEAPQQPTQQSTLRKLAPDENITLDADRAVMNPRHTEPVYYPQQEEDTSIIGHLKDGAVDATRRLYGLSSNLIDITADKVDQVDSAVRMKYHDTFGYPQQDPNAPDEIQSFEGNNAVSRKLREIASRDAHAERVLSGQSNAMNIQDSVTYDDVKQDPLSLKTGRFVLEQGARSVPEMAVAMIPGVGLPTVLGTTTQNILEERNVNQGRDATAIPTGEDLQTALLYATPSAILERAGALGDVGKLPNPLGKGNVNLGNEFGGAIKTPSKISEGLRRVGNVTKSAAGEAGTEFIQENLELQASTQGTDVDVSIEDRFDAGIQGALVGGPMGGAIRTGVETVDAVTNKKPKIKQKINQGFTEQDLGTDAQDTQADVTPEVTPPIVAQVEAPLNRNDLSEAINNDTPLPKNKTIDLPEVDIDPVLQAQGITVGAKVDQVTESGEVFEGTVASAQEIEGELEVTIIDNNGELRTLFASDGQIGVDNPPAPVVEEVQSPDFAPPPFNAHLEDQGQVETPPPLQPVLEPEAPVTPEVTLPTPVEPQQPESEYEGRSVDQLKNSLDVINQQGRRSGWNKMLTENKKKVVSELNERFPEWDVPKKADIQVASEDVQQTPTEGQKEAGNYKKGHVSIQGLPITLENPKGSERSGTDRNGQKWSVQMPDHYGYIKRTEGADGDHVDVYVGESPSSDTVYVLDQIDADSKDFDEHKVFLGFQSEDQVKISYNGAFNDGRATERYVGMKQMSMSEFKDWLKNGNTKKPIVYKKAEAPVADKPKPAVENTQAEPENLTSQEPESKSKPDQEKTDSSVSNENNDLQDVGETNVGNIEPQNQEKSNFFEAKKTEFKKSVSPSVISKHVSWNTDTMSDAELIKSYHYAKFANFLLRYPSYITSKIKNSESHVFSQLGSKDLIDKTISELQSRGIFEEADNSYNIDVASLKKNSDKSASIKQDISPSKEPTSTSKPPTSTSKSSKPAPTPKNSTTEKIEDFGEKLEGAKKDLWSSYTTSLSDPLPENSKDIKLSKVFPEPNYEKLIEAGMDMRILASIKAMRDEIPNKPRQPYKMKSWVSKVDMVRDMASKLLDGTRDVDYFLEKMKSEFGLSDFAKKIEMYADLGYPAFTKAKGWKIRKTHGVIENGKKLEGTQWFVAEKSYWGDRVDSYEAGIKLLKSKLENAKPKAKTTKLGIYQNSKTKEIHISKKIGSRKFIKLKGGFESAKEAALYLDENYDALLELLKKKKDIPNERRTENNARVGKDYRKGKSIDPDTFQKEFGFRGVQFGNYVGKDLREDNLNDTYDSLKDMADIVGIPERAISLDGTLGLAFGARGSGGKNSAAAHYDPDNIVINLTKKSGAGSLAHEWFHGMDHNFGKRIPNRKYLTEDAYSTVGKEVREEVIKAFKGIMTAIDKTDIEKRSKLLDNTRSKDYWTTGREMSARSFEAYIVYKAEQKGESNDFLANIVGFDAYKSLEEGDAYPYPTMQEMTEHIAPAFDKLFETIKTQETENGVAMFSLNSGLQSQLLKSAKELKQEKGSGAQMLAMLRKATGVKEEEISWTGLDDFLKNRGGVTKQEVVDYLNENQVKIEDVTLGSSEDLTVDEFMVQSEYENLSEKIEDADLNDKILNDFLEKWYDNPSHENWSSLANRLEGFGIDTPPYSDFVTDQNEGAAKFGEYTLPGGDNYREVLFTLPVDSEAIIDRANETGNTYRTQKHLDTYSSSHFEQENILAHVRLNDRTDADGNKVLFVEEIQSDWHQEGRKKGYRSEGNLPDGVTIEPYTDYRGRKIFSAMKNGRKYFGRANGYDNQEITAQTENEVRDILTQGLTPDAPFKKNWHEMAFRQIAQMASQNGYDSIAWTPGEVQNERFDLSKQVEAVAYWKNNIDPKKYDVRVDLKDTMDSIHKREVSLSEIEEFIGKEISEKISKGEGDVTKDFVNDSVITEIKGDGLKVGGEGMKGFYDKILKNYAQKFGKKYGAKVGVNNIPLPSPEYFSESNAKMPSQEEIAQGVWKVWSMPVTDKMRESANEGFALFKKSQNKKDKIDAKVSGDIMNAVNKRLKSLGWPQANFEISNDLDSKFGVSGVDGAYWRGMIHVSMGAKDILSTINHEVIHGLKAFGAFTNAEWKSLEASAKKNKWREKYDIDNNYKDVLIEQGVTNPTILESKLNEEAIAHAFQDVTNKGAVRRLANKSVRFIKAIGDVLRGKKFNMKTADDVFKAVQSGEIGKRIKPQASLKKEVPMFQLSKQKKPALEQATKTLSNITGLDSPIVRDIKTMSAKILHPQQIAVLHKEFTGVYKAVINRFKDREMLVNDLGVKLNLYNNLKGEAKDRVNAVLEIGRLDGVTYKPDANGNITIKNESHENAVYIKEGESVTLTPTEVNAYVKARDMFDLAFDKYAESILEDYGLREQGAKTIQDVEKLRLKALKAGNTKEVKRFKEILKRLNDVQSAKKSGYIPFKRWGEAGVSVKDKDGEVIHFEKIQLSKKSKKKNVVGETKEVQEAIDRISKKYNSPDYDINSFYMKNLNESAEFIDLNEFDLLTADSDLSKEERQKVRDVIEKKIKEKGFRSHFFQSKDVAGYSDDFERAFNEYSVSISSYIARKMNQSAIDAEMTTLAESGKTELNTYAKNYLDYVDNTVEEFGFIRMTNFFLFLGGNISSGMVNLSQPFLVTAPWFKQKFSHATIAKTMTKSYSDMYKYVKPSKAGMDVFDFSDAPIDVRDALIKAQASGDFLSQSTHDAMGISNSTNKSLRGLEKAKRKTADAVALTFSVPEKMNRIVTFTSAYRMAMLPESQKKIERFVKNNHFAREMLRGKNSPEAYASAYAELAVVSTQYRVGKLNRPQIARSYGSMIFQFMSFTAQTFEAIYNISKVQGGNNKAALSSMLLAVWAFAGIKGFPFEEDMEDLIEFVYGKLTHTDLDIDAEMRDFLTSKFGKVPAEAILKGIPAAYLNMDMSQRLGFGKMLPDDASDALGVSGEIIRKPLRAIDALGRGEEMAALGEIFPSAIANPIKAYIWSDQGVITRNGNKVIDNDDVTAVDVGLKAIGITTGHISRKRDGIYSEKRADHAVKDLRNRYYSRIAKTIVKRNELVQEGKNDEADAMQVQLDNIMNEINSHNDKAPIHKKIEIRKHTVKMKVMQETMGEKARKGRKQARPRRQELKEIYDW